MKKVLHINKIDIALNKSNPPSLVVTAFGETSTAGWSNVTLRPLWNRSNPPLHGVYEFSFEGVPPSGPAAEVITETGPVVYTFSVVETPDVCKVIVYAEANFMAQLVSLPAGFAPKKQLSQATGYSNQWDLQEAFRDAIRHLPPDQHAYPDKLYHYKIISIGAEIGGLAGFNRMLVRIEG